MEQLIAIYGVSGRRQWRRADICRVWCQHLGIEVRFIQLGTPDQNAFIERFDRSYRTEALDAYIFDSLDEVRQITEIWLPCHAEASKP